MANTNAFSKWYVCGTPQNNNLTQADYAGLTWTLISKVGNVGETGKSTNVLNYNTWDTEVVDKAKGITDAGSPTIEVARDPDDAGQEILRAAAAVGNNNKYAFKEERADGPLGGTGTIFYNRGIVAGPTRPNGGNEDFDLEVFTLGFVQEEIVVKPTTGTNAPVMSAAPAITGTAQVGETLTCSTGTFSGTNNTYDYQWFANGLAIQGATSNTITLVTADVGKVFSCRVMASNAGGNAFGFSNTTTAVVAE